MKFRYQVTDSKRNVSRGELEAENVDRARLLLLKQGYDVLLLEPADDKFVRPALRFRFVGLVSVKEKMLFVKHLSLMIKAGLPLDESIEILRTQAKGSMRTILARVLDFIQKGNLLSDGLGQFSGNFNEFFVNMIRVGEQSGTLEEILINLSVKLKKDHELNTKIRSAMFYPVLTLSALAGLGFTLSVFVLPKLLGFFNSLAVEIPTSTRIFLGAAEFFSLYWFILLWALVSLIVMVIVLNRLKQTKTTMHWVVFHLPLLRSFSRLSNLSNFCRSMSLLLRSGITIDQSMEIMSRAINNNLYRKSIRAVMDDVSRGDTLSNALSRWPRHYPGIVPKMIHVGEVSGNLSETFDYLAEFYEGELDEVSKNLGTIIEPVLLIVVGLLVGFVAMSIISPIYQLTGGIGK